MFETIGTFIDNVWAGLFAFNPLDPWSAAAYFLPLVICCTSYLFETISDLADDTKNLKKYNKGEINNYSPRTTIGLILARIFLSFIPIVNIFVAIFSRLGQIINWLKYTFDIPLISKKQSRTYDESREIRDKLKSN